MASENKSPSYLEERERARRFLTQTKDGKFAADLIRRNTQPGEANVLDDDNWVDWEEVMREHRHDTIIAASCQEAREAASLSRQSSSILAPPNPSKSKLRKFFSPPLWYVLRRQIETADPDYWTDRVNQYREALKNPEWATVSPECIRASLEDLLPRGTKVEAPVSWPIHQPSCP